MRKLEGDRLIKVFWRYVEKTETCWIWKGPKAGYHYGQIGINNKDERAHVVAYKLQHDDYDPTLFVLHKCDNTLCVRGDHLFQGTQSANMQDMVNKKRNRNGSIIKLTTEDFERIRKLYVNGQSQKSIVKEYNVTQSYICNIIHKWHKYV